MKDRHYPPRFIVRLGLHGLGVFLTEDVKKGETLFVMQGEVLSSPTQTSVQMAKDQHIEDELASFMNHSCKPSAKVNRNRHAFVALQDLKKGEEITFDYTMNEEKLAVPFKCRCCGKMIIGKTTSVEV